MPDRRPARGLLDTSVVIDLERSLSRPTPEELLQRLKSRDKVNLADSVAEVVAAEREGR